MTPCPKPKRVVKKARQPLRAKQRMRGRSKRSKKSGGALFYKTVDESRRAFVRTFPCAPCLSTGATQETPTQACHLKSRGAGGPDEGNLWPGCARHHIEQHVDGIVTFQKRCWLNLARVCERIERAYQRSSL